MGVRGGGRAGAHGTVRAFRAYSLQYHKTVTTGEDGIVVTDDARLRTDSILKRAVHLDFHPLFTDRDVEDVIAGIRKVARAVL